MAIATSAALALAEGQAHARGCSERSAVIGEEHCRSFGDGWSTNYLAAWGSLEFDTSTLHPSGRTFSAVACKTCESHTFDGSALGGGTAELGGFGLRVDGRVAGPFYIGVRVFALQFGSLTTRGFFADGVTFQPGNAFAYRFIPPEAFVGARLPLSWVALRAEFGVGGQFEGLSPLRSDAGDLGATAVDWLVETRAAVDVFFTPRVTVSAFGGFNLLDTAEHSLGVQVGFHVRSFDGAFAL
jgi:hypothetical protein